MHWFQYLLKSSPGWRGAVELRPSILSTVPTVDWVLLGSGEPSRGRYVAAFTADAPCLFWQEARVIIIKKKNLGLLACTQRSKSNMSAEIFFVQIQYYFKRLPNCKCHETLW